MPDMAVPFCVGASSEDDPLIPASNAPRLTEAYWTPARLEELKKKCHSESAVIFLAWNTVATSIPRILNVLPQPAAWETGGALQGEIAGAAAQSDVLPLVWFAARHDKTLAKLGRADIPWLDRVTFAIEGLGKLMGIWAETLEDVTGDVRRWARWYAKVCSIATNIGAGLLREAEEEAGGAVGDRACRYPDFGVCNYWKLVLPAYVAMPSLVQSRWGVQALSAMDKPTQKGANLIALIITGLLTDHTAAQPSEAQARGHEILFWCCVYRKVIWRLSSAPPTDAWDGGRWRTAACSGHEQPLAYSWDTPEAGPDGRMDTYVEARAQRKPMGTQQAALLTHASTYLAQLLSSVDAVRATLDECADNLLAPPAYAESDSLSAAETAAAMHAAGHISKRELDGVLGGECIPHDYALALDTECRTAGKICSYMHRVLVSSAAQLAGVGPLTPHPGILLDTTTLATEPGVGLHTRAAASYAALQRRHPTEAGVPTPAGVAKDDANAMVLAAVALASHFKHFAYCRTCSEIIHACANRAICASV